MPDYIRSIMRYSIRKDIVTRYITDGLLKEQHEAKAKRTLNLGERNLITWADFSIFEHCLVNLLLYTDLRKSEVLALNVSDMELSHKKQI